MISRFFIKRHGFEAKQQGRSRKTLRAEQFSDESCQRDYVFDQVVSSFRKVCALCFITRYPSED